MVALTVAVGCGSGERSFTPEQFVAEANRGGAGIELGEELYTNQPGTQVYGVEVASGGGPALGGSIVLKPDGGKAEAYFKECPLLCYRAANVVLILDDEEAAPETQRRLTRAISRMARD